VPVSAIDKEILVVDLPDSGEESEGSEYSSGNSSAAESEASESEAEDAASSYGIQNVLDQVSRGFATIQDDNYLVEQHDIADAQAQQEAEISEIIKEAKELVAQTAVDDDHEMGDLSALLTQ